MMWLVVKALILTLVVGVVCIFSKSRMSAWWYAIIFILMLISQWAFSDKLHADEICIDGICYEFNYEMTEDAINDINEINSWLSKRIYMGPRNKFTPNDYANQAKFHRQEAERTFADAKSKCWYLPDLNDRQNARYCFTALIAGIAPPTPQSKLIAIILGTLAQYGLDCLDEWEYINNKMYWSQYHYEMAEFYEEALKKK